MSKIKLEDKSLLLIRKGSDLAKNVDLRKLEAVIKQMGLRDIGILLVDSFADIGKVQPHKLNRVGYYHVGKLADKLAEMEGFEKDDDDESEE